MFGRKIQAEPIDYGPLDVGTEPQKTGGLPESNLNFLQYPGGHAIELPQRPSASKNARAKTAGGRTLTVGQDISLSGTISDCDTLVVQGTVEAKDFGGRFIDIAKDGTFKGSAEIETAKIAGRFDGDLTVRNHLHIAATGCVTGTIFYAHLEIAPGGELGGNVSLLKDNG